MWFRRNSKMTSATSASERALRDRSSKPTVETPKVSPEALGEAIVALRGDGAHFGISYAQMNGYDEKLTNPNRLSEILFLMCKEPDFEETKVDFAAQCQIEELKSFAANVEGLKYSLLTPEIEDLQKEEDRLRPARQTLATILDLGNGSLQAGFDAVGFNFEEFLIETAIERREADISLVLQKVHEMESVLRPLFLRSYARGRNKYGEIELDSLYEEVGDFLNQFFPYGSLKFFFLAPPLFVVTDLALTWVAESHSDEAQPEDGIDFEHWCAQKIEDQGWTVVVSKASGDQGVDAIASRDSVSVVIQCKRYSTPIGNKAVQEAYTGARHYSADSAVVIGTGGFTKAAQELARSTDVILLDAEMIADFTTQVFDRL